MWRGRSSCRCSAAAKASASCQALRACIRAEHGPKRRPTLASVPRLGAGWWWGRGAAPPPRRAHWAHNCVLWSQYSLDILATLSDVCRQEARQMPRRAPTGFDEGIAGFIDYLDTYRRYSPHTVKAYARDLRKFRRFLCERHPVRARRHTHRLHCQLITPESGCNTHSRQRSHLPT